MKKPYCTKLAERKFLYYDSVYLGKSCKTFEVLPEKEKGGEGYCHKIPINFFELIRGMEYFVDGERKIKDDIDTNCDTSCSIFPSNTLKIKGISWKVWNVSAKEFLEIESEGVLDMYIDRRYNFPLAVIPVLPDYLSLGEGLNVGFGGVEIFSLRLTFRKEITFKDNPYFKIILDCIRGFETR